MKLDDVLYYHDDGSYDGFFDEHYYDDRDTAYIVKSRYDQLLEEAKFWINKAEEKQKQIIEQQRLITELETLLDIVEDKKKTVFEVLTNTIKRRDERIAELEEELAHYQTETPMPERGSADIYYRNMTEREFKEWVLGKPAEED